VGFAARGGCRARLALRRPGRIVLRRALGEIDLAEVERHAGHALRNAVRRWQAAQIQGGLQGTRPADHRESPSSRSERRAVGRGTSIVPGKTKARDAVWTNTVSVRTAWPLPETMIRPSNTKVHNTSALWDTAQVVGRDRRCGFSAHYCGFPWRREQGENSAHPMLPGHHGFLCLRLTQPPAARRTCSAGPPMESPRGTPRMSSWLPPQSPLPWPADTSKAARRRSRSCWPRSGS